MPSCFICEKTSTTPDLGDSTVEEEEDEDLVVGHGATGCGEAHVVAVVRARQRVPAHDLVPLCDRILDRDVKVREGSMESVSPVFSASWKRLKVAWLHAPSAADMGSFSGQHDGAERQALGPNDQRVAPPGSCVATA
jgi:hypothetical protein